ncbi:hypothetical protein [Dietzia sp. SYD-A1]|uniref:hypothetical protein n=1 Tax=Dietzia sp. SYD-A1 TaxID=2780141 RepID=UPI001891D403|nr:hypothetical protein [Dietzia sp. SYD-A1]
MLRVVASASLLVPFIVIAWLVIGPHHPVFPWAFSAGVLGILGVMGPVPEAMIPRWVTATTQRTIHRARLFGIPSVLRALDRVGWNRALGRRVNSCHGRTGLVEIRARATQSLVAHGVGAGIHAAVGIPLVFAGAWWSAVIVVVLGVGVHLVPVAMQRYVLARVDRVDRVIQARGAGRTPDS